MVTSEVSALVAESRVRGVRGKQLIFSNTEPLPVEVEQGISRPQYSWSCKSELERRREPLHLTTFA
jgi:hypothetical protein